MANRTLSSEAIAFSAAVRKEWQVMRRYPADLVTIGAVAIVVPASYVAQASGFSGGGDVQSIAAFAQRSGTTQVAGFIYLGWAVYLWISTMLWGPGSALRRERMQGSLESLHLTPVSGFTLLYAPALVQLVPAAVLFTVVGLMLRFAFGLPLTYGQLASGVVVVLVSVPVLFALGALMSVVALRFRDADGITEALRGALGILCGVTYPIAVLPAWVQPVGRVLPPTQILNLLREAVLRQSTVVAPTIRLLALLAAGLALGAAALVVLGGTLRAARRTGRLGQY